LDGLDVWTEYYYAADSVIFVESLNSVLFSDRSYMKTYITVNPIATESRSTLHAGTAQEKYQQRFV
jgi:hypothetical protein